MATLQRGSTVLIIVVVVGYQETEHRELFIPLFTRAQKLEWRTDGDRSWQEQRLKKGENWKIEILERRTMKVSSNENLIKRWNRSLVELSDDFSSENFRKVSLFNSKFHSRRPLTDKKGNYPFRKNFKTTIKINNTNFYLRRNKFFPFFSTIESNDPSMKHSNKWEGRREIERNF